jgi:hypothetical protein
MKYSLRSLMTFSIRDLFWLTVVIALLLGLWVSHRNYVIRERRLKDEHARNLDKQKADYTRNIDKLTEENLKIIRELQGLEPLPLVPIPRGL